jgi:hypothetical protein
MADAYIVDAYLASGEVGKLQASIRRILRSSARCDCRPISILHD